MNNNEKPIAQETPRDFYNREYSFYRYKKNKCPHAIHDLRKAFRRVDLVLRVFDIGNLRGANVLDVGCGLGYYTKALSQAGAKVTGLDFSEAAIDAARSTFPECSFTFGAWPDDVVTKPQYNLIWMVNFSLMNTFDIGFIERALVNEAIQRLLPGGTLVIGWNSDFSGRVVGGWSHWPIEMIETFRHRCGTSPPLVPEARFLITSWILIRCASVIGRSIPLFVVRHKSPCEAESANK